MLAFGSAVQAGDPPKGHIYIPAIGLDEPVTVATMIRDHSLNEYDEYVIGSDVEWLQGSVWIDRPGRVILAGHTPGIFEELHEVQEGDQILVFDHHTSVLYRVSRILIVPPTSGQWLRPVSRDSILLITCEGSDRLLVEGYPDENR